jgi:8-oxo-dGTP pyrophosphatase MutT (NUDIX family)
MKMEIEDEKLLLAEYQHFSDSAWKNEEIGEKRVEFFITLTTAILAGIVALITSEHANLSYADVRQIATAALSGTLLFGLVTFRRMLHRNRVTDEYRGIVRYVRKRLQERSASLHEYELPFMGSDKRLLRGGLAETIALMNSMIIAAIAALWILVDWRWLTVAVIFLIVFTFQVTMANKDRGRAKKEARQGEEAMKDKQKKKTVSQTFRAGVGAVISNAEGKVLALERKDIPGSWQLPQGGLEAGETPSDAVKREIREETGIKESDLQLLSTAPRLLVYELPEESQSPKTGLGQVQRWFLFRYQGSDEAITLGDKKEFTRWEWLPMNEVVSRVVDFKKSIYHELAEFFSDQLHTT